VNGTAGPLNKDSSSCFTPAAAAPGLDWPGGGPEAAFGAWLPEKTSTPGTDPAALLTAPLVALALKPPLNRSIPPLNPASAGLSFVEVEVGAGPWPVVAVTDPAFALLGIDAAEAGVTGLDCPELGVVITGLGPVDPPLDPRSWLVLGGGFDSFAGQDEFVVNKLPSDGRTGWPPAAGGLAQPCWEKPVGATCT